MKRVAVYKKGFFRVSVLLDGEKAIQVKCYQSMTLSMTEFKEMVDLVERAMGSEK